MKKLSCIAMSLLMICSLIPTSLAVDTYAGNAIDDSELFISIEMAEEIAELFVLDMIETDTVLWDESTEVNCIVPMLDEDSESVTAYSVELDSGRYIDLAAIGSSSSYLAINFSD